MSSPLIGEKTSVPIVWFIIAIFSGGSLLVTLSIRWSSLEAKAQNNEERIDTMDIRQEKYNEEIHTIKESIVRIEETLKGSEHRR